MCEILVPLKTGMNKLTKNVTILFVYSLYRELKDTCKNMAEA
jgi:hypothetical protein